jgi:hypothetical protein
MRILAALLVLSLSQAAFAKDLDPAEAAQIQRDQKEALDKVDQAHGNKKPSEMDADERREVVQEQEAASNGVLAKHGVSAKEYSRFVAKETPEQREEHKAASERLEKEAQAAKNKPPAAAKKQGPAEVEIQRGTGDRNPMSVPVAGHEGDVQIDRGNQDESVPVDTDAPKAKASKSKSKSKSSKRHHRR